MANTGTLIAFHRGMFTEFLRHFTQYFFDGYRLPRASYTPTNRQDALETFIKDLLPKAKYQFYTHPEEEEVKASIGLSLNNPQVIFHVFLKEAPNRVSRIPIILGFLLEVGDPSLFQIYATTEEPI